MTLWIPVIKIRMLHRRQWYKHVNLPERPALALDRTYTGTVLDKSCHTGSAQRDRQC